MQKIWKFGIFLFILNKLDKSQSSYPANLCWDLVKKFLESLSVGISFGEILGLEFKLDI